MLTICIYLPDLLDYFNFVVDAIILKCIAKQV